MRLFVYSLFFVALVPATALAQDAHPRRARVLYLTQDSPGVLVSSDQVWIPSASSEPLSVCSGATCAPVTLAESCEPPQCPGHGSIVTAAREIADVDDFPDDVEDYEAELAALHNDAVLSAIAGSLVSTHPDHDYDDDSDEDYDDDDDYEDEGVSFRQSLTFSAGGLDSGAGAVAGVGGSIGLRVVLDDDHDFRQDSEALEMILGDRFGIDLRGHHWSETEEQGPGFITAVGGALVLENRWGELPMVLPGLVGLLLPEIGVAARRDHDASFYIRMAIPADFWFGEHFGIHVELAAWVVPDWGTEDEPESLLTADLGFLLR